METNRSLRNKKRSLDNGIVKEHVKVLASHHLGLPEKEITDNEGDGQRSKIEIDIMRVAEGLTAQ